MVVCFMIALTLSALLASIAVVFQSAEAQPFSATESFECGFDPLSPHRHSMFVQFFTVGFAFIMFDIETMLIIPLLRSVASALEWSLIWSFIWLILLLGLLLEIHFGSTDWKEIS